VAYLVVGMDQASDTGMQPTIQCTFLGNGMDPTIVLTANALPSSMWGHMMGTVGAGFNKQKTAVRYVTST
jgi:hypothetical protein